MFNHVLLLLLLLLLMVVVAVMMKKLADAQKSVRQCASHQLPLMLL